MGTFDAMVYISFISHEWNAVSCRLLTGMAVTTGKDCPRLLAAWTAAFAAFAVRTTGRTGRTLFPTFGLLFENAV